MFTWACCRVGVAQPGWCNGLAFTAPKELAFTGRFFSAQEAADGGLVNRVVDPEALLPQAREMDRQMLVGVPETLVAYKRLLNEEAGTTLAGGLRIERAASQVNNSPVGRVDIDARLLLLRQINARNRGGSSP